MSIIKEQQLPPLFRLLLSAPLNLYLNNLFLLFHCRKRKRYLDKCLQKDTGVKLTQLEAVNLVRRRVDGAIVCKECIVKFKPSKRTNTTRWSIKTLLLY